MTAAETARVIREADALLAALGRENERRLPVLVPMRGQGQLFRRWHASLRLPALACGCRDPVCYQHQYGEDHAAA